MDPLPALFDPKLVNILHGLKRYDILIAAISSAPLLLAKAGLLDGIQYTAGIWDRMIESHDFISEKNNQHQPVVKDQTSSRRSVSLFGSLHYPPFER